MDQKDSNREVLFNPKTLDNIALFAANQAVIKASGNEFFPVYLNEFRRNKSLDNAFIGQGASCRIYEAIYQLPEFKFLEFYITVSLFKKKDGDWNQGKVRVIRGTESRTGRIDVYWTRRGPHVVLCELRAVTPSYV